MCWIFLNSTHDAYLKAQLQRCIPEPPPPPPPPLVRLPNAMDGLVEHVDLLGFSEPPSHRDATSSLSRVIAVEFPTPFPVLAGTTIPNDLVEFRPYFTEANDYKVGIININHPAGLPIYLHCAHLRKPGTFGPEFRSTQYRAIDTRFADRQLHYPVHYKPFHIHLHVPPELCGKHPSRDEQLVSVKFDTHLESLKQFSSTHMVIKYPRHCRTVATNPVTFAWLEPTPRLAPLLHAPLQSTTLPTDYQELVSTGLVQTNQLSELAYDNVIKVHLRTVSITPGKSLCLPRFDIVNCLVTSSGATQTIINVWYDNNVEMITSWNGQHPSTRKTIRSPAGIDTLHPEEMALPPHSFAIDVHVPFAVYKLVADRRPYLQRWPRLARDGLWTGGLDISHWYANNEPLAYAIIYLFATTEVRVEIENPDGWQEDGKTEHRKP